MAFILSYIFEGFKIPAMICVIAIQ